MLFPPPAVIETEVFARLPDMYRLQGRQSEWLTAQLRGRDHHSLLEGPTFDRDGNLYVVDVPHGRVFRIAQDGTFTLVSEYDGEPNGLALHRDGRMFVADHKRGLLLLDVASGQVTPVLERPRLEGFKGLNDLTFASNGDLYFTDQGQTGLHDPTGRVYRLAADGTLACILAGIPSPNGLVLDLDETALYVAVTRANNVWRVPFMLDGTPSKVGVFTYLSGMGGPDGMALDEQGGLAIAHIDLGTVWIFNALGEPGYRVISCTGRKTTNIVYGDHDRRTLYITEGETGTVLRARLPVAGKPLYSHTAADDVA
jgi:gluconolactonase